MFAQKSLHKLLFVVLTFVLPCFGSTFRVQAQEITLQPLQTLTIRNDENDVRSFKIAATSQRIISIEIKQNGADAIVKLFDPKGLLIAESDNPFSEQDVEKIFVIANESGDYKLETRSKFPDGKGFFSVKLNELKTATPKDFKRAEAMQIFAKAQVLRSTGKSVDRIAACKIYEQTLDLWREANDKNGEVRTLSLLSYLNRIIGERKLSLKYADSVLQMSDSPENASSRASAFYQIGQVNLEYGKKSEASESFQKALSQFAEPSPEQANTYSALGYLYQSTDEFELAETAFNASLENVKTFPDIYNEAQTRNLLGLFYYNSREYENALENFKFAADLREKFGNRRGQAISMTYQAMTFVDLKDYASAIELLQKALPISREVGDGENELNTLVYLVVSYRETGRFAEAFDTLKLADILVTGKKEMNGLNLVFGATYLRLSRFVEARARFDKALSNYHEFGDLDGESLTLYNYAKVERAENKLDAAKIKIERALEIYEYAQAKYKNIRRLLAFAEKRRGYFDLYIDILMRLDKERPNSGFAFKAFQASESARMRTLIWQLREAVKDKPQTVDYQIITELQNVQQQIGEKLTLLAKAQTNAAQSGNVKSIEADIAALNKLLENVKARLRESNPNFAALAQPPTLSLAEMQAELDDDTVLVEYSLGELNSYLWVLQKNNFQSFTLPKRAEIESQAEIVYSILSGFDSKPTRIANKPNRQNDVNNTDFNAESDKLSKLLSLDKLKNIAAKRFVFVADGALGYVPFASLSLSNDNSKSNNFISEKFEVVQLPSLTTLHILRQRNVKPFAPQSVAIIADPVFSSDDERVANNKSIKIKQTTASYDLSKTLRDFNLTKLPRLPFTRREARQIAETSPNNTTLNLDFTANRARMLNGDFDNYDILHFATHGFLNDEHPELSGLVLSLMDENGNQQNGFLRTQDLFLLKLKAQMVVLSACQTGLGKQAGNEGLLGLKRGFMENGTPRIVASLWKVEDSATAELMTRFYRAMLKDNQLPAAALRTAQNEMRQIPRFNHPRFWSGFTLTGEWR